MKLWRLVLQSLPWLARLRYDPPESEVCHKRSTSEAPWPLTLFWKKCLSLDAKFLTLCHGGIYVVFPRTTVAISLAHTWRRLQFPILRSRGGRAPFHPKERWYAENRTISPVTNSTAFKPKVAHGGPRRQNKAQLQFKLTCSRTFSQSSITQIIWIRTRQVQKLTIRFKGHIQFGLAEGYLHKRQLTSTTREMLCIDPHIPLSIALLIKDRGNIWWCSAIRFVNMSALTFIPLSRKCVTATR